MSSPYCGPLGAGQYVCVCVCVCVRVLYLLAYVPLYVLHVHACVRACVHVLYLPAYSPTHSLHGGPRPTHSAVHCSQ